MERVLVVGAQRVTLPGDLDRCGNLPAPQILPPTAEQTLTTLTIRQPRVRACPADELEERQAPVPGDTRQRSEYPLVYGVQRGCGRHRILWGAEAQWSSDAERLREARRRVERQVRSGPLPRTRRIAEEMRSLDQMDEGRRECRIQSQSALERSDGALDWAAVLRPEVEVGFAQPVPRLQIVRVPRREALEQANAL